MEYLFLSETENSTLNHTIAALEAKNGKDIYNSVNCTSGDDCLRWDCAISCYCANSLL